MDFVMCSRCGKVASSCRCPNGFVPFTAADLAKCWFHKIPFGSDGNCPVCRAKDAAAGSRETGLFKAA